MSRLEISIPTVSTSPPPVHTVYHITVRLPLRTLSLQKRYSDFASLHSTLVSLASAPPSPLPSKTIFSSTVKNPALAEQRRQGLEAYLRAINDSPDPKWRNTAAWRSFLNLPAETAGTAAPISSGPISDPVAWLDAHRELKGHLHAARTHIAEREAGATATHEAAAQAKKSLVRAAALLAPLEKGLRDNGAEWSRNKLGEGEVRRRKDLLTAARREVDGLENLASLVGRKADADKAVSDLSQDKATLVGTAKGVGRGRVLGKETDKTRGLDNKGVLQLQQQIMKEQDQDVQDLATVIRRQKELGLQIQQELDVQNDMLQLLDEDVDRVEGKLKVARKRADKIS